MTRSTLKRKRQDEKRRLRNVRYKSTMKTMIKRVLKSVESKDKEGANQALVETVSVISKAAPKGVIPQKRASRKISRLSQKVNTLEARLVPKHEKE